MFCKIVAVAPAVVHRNGRIRVGRHPGTMSGWVCWRSITMSWQDLR